jgi:hypothetical protein
MGSMDGSLGFDLGLRWAAEGLYIMLRGNEGDNNKKMPGRRRNEMRRTRSMKMRRNDARMRKRMLRSCRLHRRIRRRRKGL